MSTALAPSIPPPSAITEPMASNASACIKATCIRSRAGRLMREAGQAVPVVRVRTGNAPDRIYRRTVPRSPGRAVLLVSQSRSSVVSSVARANQGAVTHGRARDRPIASHARPTEDVTEDRLWLTSSPALPGERRTVRR